MLSASALARDVSLEPGEVFEMTDLPVGGALLKLRASGFLIDSGLVLSEDVGTLPNPDPGAPRDAPGSIISDLFRKLMALAKNLVVDVCRREEKMVS